MSTPYVGEIRIFAGNFAPNGWMFCEGQALAIAENDTLFNLIGTTYGGDGQNTFNLPDLRGRLPVHMGQGPGLSSYVIGQRAGSETVTLTTTQLPVHSHPPLSNGSTGDSATPTGEVWGTWSEGLQYSGQQPTVPMSAFAVGASGGNQPHDNMPPFLCVYFIISLFGVYPSQA